MRNRCTDAVEVKRQRCDWLAPCGVQHRNRSAEEGCLATINGRAHTHASPTVRAHPNPHGAGWLGGTRRAMQAVVEDFVTERCLPQLQAVGLGVAAEVLADFIAGGKCVRSTFMYLGWLCGAEDDSAALRAAASLELLHAFALLQDDVMDEPAATWPAVGATSRSRGGTVTAAVRAHRAGSASPRRCLLGDLCLVWAGQMMRTSGMSASALERVWPRYDAMCIELAIGQFGDLVNDAAGFPTWTTCSTWPRRKSGNYTVRRPLEMGAAMAGCDEHVLAPLGRYGEAIGEAFQMRDDVLGIFGSPAVTGKPIGSDLAERKATSVVVAAHQLADADARANCTS